MRGQQNMKTLCALTFAFLLSAPASLQAELPTKKVLTLGVAKKLVAAAETEAKKRGATVVIAVVDDGGQSILLERLDDTQVASVEVALALPRATPLQGGVPITVEGKVIGAISASGNSPQEDEEIALSGAAVITMAVQEEGH
jgi:glc operon protein GlcG